jgi:hypothetical protein
MKISATIDGVCRPKASSAFKFRDEDHAGEIAGRQKILPCYSVTEGVGMKIQRQSRAAKTMEEWVKRTRVWI